MSKKEKKRAYLSGSKGSRSLSGTRSFVFACRLGNPKLKVVISVCCCRYLIVCLFVPFCLSPHTQAWMITPLPTPAPPPSLVISLGHRNVAMEILSLWIVVIFNYLSCAPFSLSRYHFSLYLALHTPTHTRTHLTCFILFSFLTLSFHIKFQKINGFRQKKQQQHLRWASKILGETASRSPAATFHTVNSRRAPTWFFRKTR